MLVNLSVARHGLANLTIRPDLVTVPLTASHHPHSRTFLSRSAFFTPTGVVGCDPDPVSNKSDLARPARATAAPAPR